MRVIKLETIKIILLLILFIVFPVPILAHPGRTAADGCHYCKTDCASWGEVEGARHCHGNGSEPVQESAPIQQYFVAPTNTPRPLPTWTPIPTKTLIPTKSPTPSLTLAPTKVPTKIPTLAPTNLPKLQEQSVSGRGLWGWLISLFL